MIKLRKSSKILIGITAAMTVCAAIAMNSAFARIEENMSNPGGDISRLVEEIEVRNRLSEVLGEMQADIDDAARQLEDAIAEQKTFTLKTQKAKDKNAELDWAIKCLNDELYIYKEKKRVFSTQMGIPSMGGPTGKPGVLEKLRIFVMGMPDPNKKFDDLKKLRDKLDKNPGRKDKDFLKEIEETVQGEDKKRLEDSKGYCERMLKETREAVKASQNTNPGSNKKPGNSSSSNSGTNSGGGGSKPASNPAPQPQNNGYGSGNRDNVDTHTSSKANKESLGGVAHNKD